MIKYSSRGAENLLYREFLNWWDSTIKQCMRLDFRLFSFVIDSDHEEDMTYKCLDNNLTFVDRHELGKNKSQLAKYSRVSEILLVFSNKEKKQVRSKRGLRKLF